MTTPHPADTAKLGDAFRDENGATWLLTDDVDTYSWITSGVDKTQWRTTADAHEHTLTPLVPEDDGGVDVEVIDVSDPAQLRRAADVVVASSVGIPGQRNVLADALRAEADRLDAEAADRAKAEQIARDHLGHGRWTATVRSTQNAITEAVLAGIRAGRDAEAG